MLATLRFYATGSFFIVMGDFIGISESSMSKVVKQTSIAIAQLKSKFIHFPSNRRETIEDFHSIAGFPNVIGAIDCTHVKIIGQGGDVGELYRNRKHFFSINVQSVAGPDLKFYDIVARWPGSTHDSFIFNQSKLKTRLEIGEFDDLVILGDGGYALNSYMMTPFRTPSNPIETHFNKIQAKTRNTVERKYGVFKRRFPCLAFGLRCLLQTSLTVIVACAILHNFCIMHNIPDPPEEESIEAAVAATSLNNEENENRSAGSNQVSNGRIRRNVMANQLYAHLQRQNHQ